MSAIKAILWDLFYMAPVEVMAAMVTFVFLSMMWIIYLVIISKEHWEKRRKRLENKDV